MCIRDRNKYLDGRNVSNCSQETKTDIDKEVVRVLKECHEKAFNILKENRDALDAVSYTHLVYLL